MNSSPASPIYVACKPSGPPSSRPCTANTRSPAPWSITSGPVSPLCLRSVPPAPLTGTARRWKKLVAAIPAYHSAISNVAARLAAVYPAPKNALQVNKHYASFILPFWWEHVLLRCVIDPVEHQKMIDTLGSPAVLPPAPAPAPPPAPAAYQHPPPPPGWAHPFALPPPMGVPLYPPPPGATPHGLPYGPGAPPPYAPPAAHTPAPRAQQPPCAGKVVPPLIYGNNFGIVLPGNPRTCSCTISRAFPGRIHHPFEFPLRLHQMKGSCPGWTPTGLRIPSAWSGDNITTATQAEWRTLQATLLPAIVAKGTPDITF